MSAVNSVPSSQTPTNSGSLPISVSNSFSAGSSTNTPPALPSSTPNSAQTNATPASSVTTTPLACNSTVTQLSIPAFNEEKIYKKEKQIFLEFDGKTKDLKSQLNEGIKCLEQRLDTQISILYELQDFFKKRADVEMQYSRDLDKMTKQIYAKHKSEKSKRETWHLHSTYRLWESLLNDTKTQSRYHQVMSEICSKYVADKFDDIIEDQKRIFTKCKGISQASHEEVFKVVGELNGAMKTYHEYQNESKQAEAKLKYVQSQKPKYEKTKSKKKLKQYEKQVEKRLQKYTETKVKAFKARNEYILSINSANACINKYCTEDISDLVDCMDFGFHTSAAKCIYMYLSAQENIKRSRQQTMDNLSRSIGDLDSNADKQSYLDHFASTFSIQKKFQFEPYKGDEVSQVNAQSLIRYEMEKRFEQLDDRLQTLKTENDEIFKTIEATEQSLLNYFDIKNTDMSDLFRDLNLPSQNTALNKEKRIEIENYYVEKVKQYSISSNLIARLESRHKMMQKALNGCVNSAEKSLEANNMSCSSGGGAAPAPASADQLKPKKKIGKSPIIGQPRLFGGKLTEYINATKQEIPQIITSCIKAINRLGLHNQGIFRIPGSQLEINQFKEAFEKGEDPLVTVNPREMNSVAGVLKLYLRELKDPLFPRESYDAFLNALRANLSANSQVQHHSAGSDGNASQNTSAVLNSSIDLISTAPFENIEATKVENIRKVMNGVSRPIYVVLRFLFAFLNHLSEFKDENMMDAYNIAICLAPTLIPVPEDKKDHVNNQTDTIELIKLIIQHNDEIFSMDFGDSPMYEKFESEVDNEEENIEESDEEDDEESEKQFMRNLSDDETYATEAIALYDYKGRSDKEISFKKGTILAIRSQLSTDWWQGSFLPSSTNPTPRLGYIPDKYIALRTNNNNSSSSNTTKKRTQSISTPQSIHTSKLSTPSSISSSLRETNSLLLNGGGGGNTTPTAFRHHHQYSLKHHHTSSLTSSVPATTVASASSIDLDFTARTNLTELMQVKESDILNDESESNNHSANLTDSTLQALNAARLISSNLLSSHHLPSVQTRSPSVCSSSFQQQQSSLNGSGNNNGHMANGRGMFIKKRTASSTSSHSIYDTHTQPQSSSTVVASNNMQFNANQPFSIPSLAYQHQPYQQYTNYLTLSNPYKPTLKTNPNVSYTPNNGNSSMNSSIDDLLLNGATAAAAGRGKKMSQIENALASVLDDMKQLDFSTGIVNISNQPDQQQAAKQPINDSKITTNSSLMRQAFANGLSSPKPVSMHSSLKQRPDIVMDIPVNLLASSPQPNSMASNMAINGNKQENKVRRLSVDNNNKNGGGKQLVTHQSSAPPLGNVKEYLQSSSTTSTESTSENSSLTSTSSVSINSVHNNNNNNKNNNNDNNLTNSSVNPVNGSLSSKSAQSPGSNIIPSMIRLLSLDVVGDESVSGKKSNGNVLKLEEEKSSGVVSNANSKDEFEKVATNFDLQPQPPMLANVNKKKPPPLMKKPEKSEEIMRKLGKSPPQVMPNDTSVNMLINSTSSISANSTISSLSSSTQSNPILATANLNIMAEEVCKNNLEHQESLNGGLSPTSNGGCTSSKSNLSVRLSNSKATDV